ncbi:MAG: hypothetical protein ACM3ML_22950 [Micromonosporaceae bacterium]
MKAAAAAVAGTGLALGGVAAASASQGPVTAVTHSSQHDDTTSVSSACTLANAGPGGPVWAYDNLSLRYAVTPETGPGNYSVTIHANGSFKAICDPVTGDPATFNGSVDGWITYDVSSPNTPDPKNVPAQEPDHTGLGAGLSRLFGGSYSIVGGGDYSFTYNPVEGCKYIQNTAGSTLCGSPV